MADAQKPITLKGSVSIVKEFFGLFFHSSPFFLPSPPSSSSLLLPLPSPHPFPPSPAYAVNSILFQRGIYPSEFFEVKKKYGLPMMVTTDPGLRTYVSQILKFVERWLGSKDIQVLFSSFFFFFFLFLFPFLFFFFLSFFPFFLLTFFLLTLRNLLWSFKVWKQKRPWRDGPLISMLSSNLVKRNKEKTPAPTPANKGMIFFFFFFFIFPLVFSHYLSLPLSF